VARGTPGDIVQEKGGCAVQRIARWRHDISPVTEGVSGGVPARRSNALKRRRRPRAYQPAIDVEIVLGHAARREARLEDASDPRAIKFQANRRATAAACASSSTMKPVTPWSTTSGTEPRRKADDWGPAGHRLDHREAERFVPRDREDQPGGSPRNVLFSASLISPRYSTLIVEQRLYARAEVFPSRRRPWRQSSASCRRGRQSSPRRRVLFPVRCGQ